MCGESHENGAATEDHPAFEAAHYPALLELVTCGKSKDVCRTNIAVDGPRPDSAVLRRQNQVCLRSEDQVTEDHLVSRPQLRRGRSRRKDKLMKVPGIAVIQSDAAVCLQRPAQ